MGQQSTIEMRPGGPITELESIEAREIQQSLLPAGTLQGPSFEIAYRSCEETPFENVTVN